MTHLQTSTDPAFTGLADLDDSQQIQNPLTLIMTLEPGTDPRIVAGLLAENRQRVYEAFRRLSTVHFARFVFLCQGTQLAIITSYDGLFDRYVTDFAHELGFIFDALFEHVQDAPPLPVHKNVDEFIAYGRANNAPTVLFSAYPDLTVPDILELQRQAVDPVDKLRQDTEDRFDRVLHEVEKVSAELREIQGRLESPGP